MKSRQELKESSPRNSTLSGGHTLWPSVKRHDGITFFATIPESFSDACKGDTSEIFTKREELALQSLSIAFAVDNGKLKINDALNYSQRGKLPLTSESIENMDPRTVKPSFFDRKNCMKEYKSIYQKLLRQCGREYKVSDYEQILKSKYGANPVEEKLIFDQNMMHMAVIISEHSLKSSNKKTGLYVSKKRKGKQLEVFKDHDKGSVRQIKKAGNGLDFWCENLDNLIPEALLDSKVVNTNPPAKMHSKKGWILYANTVKEGKYYARLGLRNPVCAERLRSILTLKEMPVKRYLEKGPEGLSAIVVFLDLTKNSRKNTLKTLKEAGKAINDFYSKSSPAAGIRL